MRLNLSNEQIEKLETIFFKTVCETLDDGRLIYQIDYIETMSLNALWNYFDNPNTDLMMQVSSSFEYRREAFLWVLERLLKEDRIKLANNALMLARQSGEPWDEQKYLAQGTIEEQIETFRQAWPNNEEIMDDGIWFFNKACPYCVIWQQA